MWLDWGEGKKCWGRRRVGLGGMMWVIGYGGCWIMWFDCCFHTYRVNNQQIAHYKWCVMCEKWKKLWVGWNGMGNCGIWKGVGCVVDNQVFLRRSKRMVWVGMFFNGVMWCAIFGILLNQILMWGGIRFISVPCQHTTWHAWKLGRNNINKIHVCVGLLLCVGRWLKNWDEMGWWERVCWMWVQLLLLITVLVHKVLVEDV